MNKYVRSGLVFGGFFGAVVAFLYPIFIYPRMHVQEYRDENNNFIIQELLRPVPRQSMVEQATKHGSIRPQRGYPGNSFKVP
uniref:Small integral membrane protein 20 n=1 Tax=Eptatretus burgeri TaxID=7764 RepID=A0A8C4R783_EPTBU